MTHVVRSELLRMLGLFAETDPRSIEYTQLMRNFEILANQSDMYDEVEALLSEEDSEPQKITVLSPAFKTESDEAGGTGGGITDASERDSMGAVEHDTGAYIVGNSPPSKSSQVKDREIEPQGAPVSEDTAPSDAVPSEAGEHPEYKMEDVRAALVTARRKRGVNVTELLREFGVDNFGSFPAGRYWELMQRLGGDG